MNLQNFLKFIGTDQFGFSLFEGIFVLLFLYALSRDRILKEKSVVSAVYRGDKSLELFQYSANIFTTLFVSVIFAITTHPKDGRVILYIINLLMIIYLFFYSGWFTNKLVGWYLKFKERNFNPHGQ